MSRFRPLVLLALLLALPAASQLGYSGAQGLRIQLQVAGSVWTAVATGRDRAQAGRVGSGAPIEGLAISHMSVPLRLQVRTAKGWLPWAGAGVRTGSDGQPITGMKLEAEGRRVRYRGSFVGRGVGGWASDGEAIEAGGAALEALDVEVMDAAPLGTRPFEYRVSFAGSGFGPWVKSGEPVEAKGPDAYVTGFEVRGGGGIRYEARLEPGGWQPTAAEGETAGDPAGRRPVVTIRLFDGAFPIRYRVRPAHGDWGPWQDGGAEAGTNASGLKLTALELDLKR